MKRRIQRAPQPTPPPAAGPEQHAPLSPSDALKALTWWRLRMTANRNERSRDKASGSRTRHP